CAAFSSSSRSRSRRAAAAFPSATASPKLRRVLKDAQPCDTPAPSPASFRTGVFTAKLTERTASSTASTAWTALDVAVSSLSSCALTRSTEPPTLLMTGSTSRSAPRINDESRSNVTANRRKAQPRPTPAATRNTDSATRVRSPKEKATITGATLLHGARDQPGTHHDVAVVEDRGLAARDAVRRLVEPQPEAGRRPFDGRADGRRAVAQLRLGAAHVGVQAAARRHARPGERPARPDDDGVRARDGAERVEGLARGDAEPAALARREPPVAAVGADARAGLVDQLAVCGREPLPGEELAVVGA